MIIDFQWSCDCLTTCVGCENPCFPIKTLAILLAITTLIWFTSTIIINTIRALKNKINKDELMRDKILFLIRCPRCHKDFPLLSPRYEWHRLICWIRNKK